jgi:predicted metal-binding protein
MSIICCPTNVLVCFRGAECNTDHYLVVAKVREYLEVNKQYRSLMGKDIISIVRRLKAIKRVEIIYFISCFLLSGGICLIVI